MSIPKIQFREMTLDENIEEIKWMFYDVNGTLSVHNFTIKVFPELANIDINTPKEKAYEIIEKVVTNNYEKIKEKIKNDVDRYNKLWKEYNDKYFDMLASYFKIDWPKIDVIEAKVGLLPVFPRYLDSFSFAIGTGIEDYWVIKTAAHETLHFMWFEKWKQIHPETPRREYDSPYITWQYSEMVTDPVLNNEPFNKLFGNVFEERGYDSFYELYDRDNLVMDNLRNIFSENISVEEKMDKGFKYITDILKHEESENIARK